MYIVTFKDLKNRISLETAAQTDRFLEGLRNKPIWLWNIEEYKVEDVKTAHEGTDMPMFDYERSLYDALLVPENSNRLNHDFKHKRLWVKKAAGLGITEFMLRLMVWLCLKDDTYRNSQMCIVSGPNQDIAIKLIKRMKTLFEPHNVMVAATGENSNNSTIGIGIKGILA
jgi:hypothetical protein